jgi:hypothetical protein
MPGEIIRAQVRKLERWIGLDLGFDPIAHLDAETTVLADIEDAVADEPFFRTKRFGSVEELGAYRIVMYCLIRLLRPQVFVETGVLHGLTSLFLLQALSENGCGRLVSVDLPSFFETGPANQDGFTDTLPPDRQPGWVVPQRLHGLWDLRLGSSRDILPEVAEECSGQSVVFLHDSDHTHENMTWELAFAWEHFHGLQMAVADNVDFNTAFFDFTHSLGRPPMTFLDTDGRLRFGMVRRPQVR